jgi:S1-C subfamily serine protease
VTLVDVLIVVFVVGSIVHGLFLGAVVQLLSVGGFLAGLAAGALVAPTLAGRVDDPATARLLTIVVVFGTATVAAALGRSVGIVLWRALYRLRLSAVDAGAGAVVGGVAALVTGWLVGTMLSTLPHPGVADQIQRSAVLRTLDRALPPAPVVIARVQSLLDERGLPPVFIGIPPPPAERLPPPDEPPVRAAFEQAADATVFVTALGCPALQQGSGFVAAADLIVTNAHVIAGGSTVQVGVGGRNREAVPVLFDPELDIAVLRVAGLGVAPLTLAAGEVERGTIGAAVGHPLGGPLAGEPAVVLRRLDATGRDIYGSGRVVRPVYELQARVRPGNSGGPVVDPSGTVIGVVFSRSAADAGIGYAVTSPPVAARVGAAAARTDPVDLGPCRTP